MTIQQRKVGYFHGGARLEGWMAWNDGAAQPRPGVLVAPTWAGRNEFACDKARALAELGYVGFALDLYGDGRVGEGPAACSALMAPFMADRALLQGRMLAAFEALRQQPEVDPGRIGAIGFCFGGLCVLDLARSGADAAAVVSFHGLLSPPPDAGPSPVQARVLVLHGYDDPMAPPDHLLALADEFSAAGADWQFHAYGGTQHAFTNPMANDPAMGTVYNPVADRRSWQSMTNFLAEVLK